MEAVRSARPLMRSPLEQRSNMDISGASATGLGIKNRLQQKLSVSRPTTTRIMLKSSSGHLGIGRGLMNTQGSDGPREVQSSTLKAPMKARFLVESPEKSPSKDLFRMPAPRVEEQKKQQQLHLLQMQE